MGLKTGFGADRKMARHTFISLLLFAVFSWYALPCQGQDTSDFRRLSALSAPALFEKGEELETMGQPDSAMTYFIALIGKYSQRMPESDKRLCALAYASSGRIYYGREIYPQAFDSFFGGLKICEENGYTDLMPKFYINMGNIYSMFGDNSQAVLLYEKGLEYARKCGNRNIEIKLLMNLAGICTFAGQTEKAHRYYNEMMTHKGADSLIEYFGYQDLALIEASSGQNKEAVGNFRSAIRYARERDLPPMYAASACGELAKLYRNTGETDSALFYYRQNARFTEEHKLHYMLVSNLQALTEIYREIGDRGKADFYQNKYFALSDSLFGIDEYTRLKNSLFLYEMNKNYREIEALTNERERKEDHIRRQRGILLSVSVCLLVAGIFSAVVYSQKKKLNRAYKDLFFKNQEMLQRENSYKGICDSYTEQMRLLSGRCDELEAQLAEQEKGSDRMETPEFPARAERSADIRIEEQQKEQILHDIMRIMEHTEDFCSPDFSLAQLAALIGSNSRYVSAVINDTFHKNFRSFVNEYRIKEACLRLSDVGKYGSYTIKAIAESVGYRSHTAFINIFKEQTGITPSVYQKIALKMGGSTRMVANS